MDEVPTEAGRALISRLVEAFVSRFDQNRYVVTSRVRGYTGGAILRKEFVRCDIQDFDESDRSEFLKNWFAALLKVERHTVLEEGSASKTEYDALSSSIERNERIRILAVNPLLMTVIAIVHWNRKRLPDQRVDLYDECVDVLLGQRKDAERFGRHVDGGFAKETDTYDRTWTRKRFSEIALWILESGSDEMTRDMIVNLLQPRFIDRGANGATEAATQAIEFLSRQEVESGLLVSRRVHSFRFVHLTFQEYLAAWNLANQPLDSVHAVITRNLRNPQWFETLQLLGGEFARNSDDRLDRYFSYLLTNLGTSIAQKAPVIALCSNILSDVRGVADISTDTRRAYTTALRGTLAAFNRGSGVSANTQLEVLFGLSQLGVSVKEHLIRATKSTYYQVRCEALRILQPFLSDDELFGMKELLDDRSQETISIYLFELFKRDKARALEILRNKPRFTDKASKGIMQLLYSETDFSQPEVLEIGMKSFEAFDYWGTFLSAIVYRLSALPNVRDDFLDYLINVTQSSENLYFRWKAVTLIGAAYPNSERIVTPIRHVILNKSETGWIRNAALTIPSKSSQSFDIPAADLMAWYAQEEQSGYQNAIINFLGSRYIHESSVMDCLLSACSDNATALVRQSAFNYLAVEVLGESLTDKILVSKDLNGRSPFIDPGSPITSAWISKCSAKIGVSEHIVRQMFQSLSRRLPITLQKD